MKKRLLLVAAMFCSVSLGSMAACSFLTPSDTSDCTHVYGNACDADCNECGDTRTPADHVYDGEGDRNCNECGDVRELNKYTVTFITDGGSEVAAQTVEYA